MFEQPQHDPLPGPLVFDPAGGTVVASPPGVGEGHWAGAPGACFDETTGRFYLTYRLRRPRGVEPDRGAETRVACSSDGVEFETIWRGFKHELGTSSIERSAIRRLKPDLWALYVSYVDPRDSRWRIDTVLAPSPDAFDLRTARPALLAAPLGLEGVKDPLLVECEGRLRMIVSFATADPAADRGPMHATQDAYNTGLIRSRTGLASSRDGLEWQWEGEILAPSDAGWDRYCARIGAVYRENGTWIAFYDGSADVSENYEERVGVAMGPDLHSLARVTTEGPWMECPSGKALRYFDVLNVSDSRLVYYEMALPDGSHDLRVWKGAKPASPAPR